MIDLGILFLLYKNDIIVFAYLKISSHNNCYSRKQSEKVQVQGSFILSIKGLEI